MYRNSLFCSQCKQSVKEKEIIFTKNKLGICQGCYNPNEFKPN